MERSHIILVIPNLLDGTHRQFECFIGYPFSHLCMLLESENETSPVTGMSPLIWDTEYLRVWHKYESFLHLFFYSFSSPIKSCWNHKQSAQWLQDVIIRYYSRSFLIFYYDLPLIPIPMTSGNDHCGGRTTLANMLGWVAYIYIYIYYSQMVSHMLTTCHSIKKPECVM